MCVSYSSLVRASTVAEWKADIFNGSSAPFHSAMSIREQLAAASCELHSYTSLRDSLLQVVSSTHSQKYHKELQAANKRTQSLRASISKLQKLDKSGLGEPTLKEIDDARAHQRAFLKKEIEELSAVVLALNGTFKRGHNQTQLLHNSEKAKQRKKIEVATERKNFLLSQLQMMPVPSGVTTATPQQPGVPLLLKLEAYDALAVAIRCAEELQIQLPKELKAFIETCLKQASELQKAADGLQARGGEFESGAADDNKAGAFGSALSARGEATALLKAAAQREAWATTAKSVILPDVPSCAQFSSATTLFKECWYAARVPSLPSYSVLGAMASLPLPPHQPPQRPLQPPLQPPQQPLQPSLQPPQPPLQPPLQPSAALSSTSSGTTSSSSSDTSPPASSVPLASAAAAPLLDPSRRSALRSLLGQLEHSNAVGVDYLCQLSGKRLTLPRKQEVSDLLIPALDEEDLAQFDMACAFPLSSTLEVKALPTKGGSYSPLTEGDLGRVKPGEWGNDELVNAYFWFLQKDDSTRSATSQQRRSLFLTSHFANKFHEENGDLILDYGGLHGSLIEGLQRWIQGVDIHDLEFIFIPVKTGRVGGGCEHWYLIVVHMQERTIKCVDSIAVTSRKEFMLRVHDFLLKAEERTREDSAMAGIDSRPWVISESAAYDESSNLVCPQQSNSCDCAYFTMTAAEFTSRRLPLLYSQFYMGAIRQKICARLLSLEDSPQRAMDKFLAGTSLGEKYSRALVNVGIVDPGVVSARIADEVFLGILESKQVGMSKVDITQLKVLVATLQKKKQRAPLF